MSDDTHDEWEATRRGEPLTDSTGREQAIPTRSDAAPFWTCMACGAASDRQSCPRCGSECRPAGRSDAALIAKLREWIDAHWFGHAPHGQVVDAEALVSLLDEHEKGTEG